MTARDSNLYKLYKQFVIKGLSVLSEVSNNGELVPIEEFYDLGRLGDQRYMSFTTSTRKEFKSFMSQLRYNNLLKQMEEYQKCIDYLQKIGIPLKFIDIGEEYLLNFIEEIVILSESFDFKEQVFQREYEAMESFIFDRIFTAHSFIRLDGFTSEKDCIQLDTQHFIRKPTEEECKEFWRSQPLRFLSFEAIESTLHPNDYVLEIKLEDNVEEIKKYTFALRAAEEKALLLLRLFKSGIFTPIHIEYRVASWTPFKMSQFRGIRIISIQGPKYHLSIDECDQLIAFWNRFSSFDWEKSNALRTAVSRFMTSYNRRYFKTEEMRKNLEDSLVDIIFGLESLCAAEGSGDITYKLSVHGTILAGINKSNEERWEIYNTLKKAYDIRSKIVHGGSKIDSEIKIPHINIKYSLEELVHQTQRYLAEAIKTFAELSLKYRDDEIKRKIVKSAISGGIA